MEIRYYIDPESGEPHIYRHDVSDAEVEDILTRPIEDRPEQKTRASLWARHAAADISGLSTCRIHHLVVSL